VIVFTFFSVIQEKEELYLSLDRQLEDAAFLTPLLLPQSLHHQAMNKNDLSPSKNYENTLSLSKFTDQSDIVYLYTLVLREGKLSFSSSSATEEERKTGKGLTSFFDVYDDADPGVYDVFETRQKAFLEYTDQWGSFRSVYIPTYSLDGTFYLVVADVSTIHVKKLLYQQIYQSVAIGFLFLLFFYLMYLAATFRIKNITQRLDNKVRTQTSELFQKEKRLNYALKSAQQSWFDQNLMTNELAISDEIPKLLKYNVSQFKMDLQTWKKIIHHDDKSKVQNLFNECLKTGGPVSAEYRLQALDGNWLWVQSVAEIIEWNEKKTPSRMVGIHRDITQQKRSDDVLRALAETGDTEEGDIFKTIVRQLALSNDVRYAYIACLNPDDNNRVDTIALWANGAVADNFSYSLTATPCAAVLARTEDTICYHPNHIQDIFPDDQLLAEMEAESYLGVPLINAAGKSIGIICIIDDKPMSNHQQTFDLLKSLTVRANIELERKESKEKLEMMAHYDLLTQLPNRSLFADRFNQAIAHSKRTDSMIAICFLDLDNFKPVNDSYGHETGDKLLIEGAKSIKSSIRDEDSVSRQGGDEFTLLLRDIKTFNQCENMLQRVADAVAQPYIINDYTHKITASIGFTLCPLENSDLGTLIRQADQAMYQAKLLGGNQFYTFNTLDDQKMASQQGLLSEIKQALASRQFQLYYQPKVNMKTGLVFGVEALIRWIHPNKGLIAPLDILPSTAGTDLELQIGGWVINQALSQMDIWKKNNIKLEVSINISSHHIQSNAFFDQLNNAFQNHPDVDPQYLQLEILESSTLGDINAISGIIKNCQNQLGISVALDDFGTGYSSLTHMKNLSANTIKIDQTFVRDLLDDPDDYSIIEGIIGLAKAFNRDVIAEGVETDSHGLMLLIMGCNQAQGYGISKPLPAEMIPTWLGDYKPNPYWIEYENNNFNPLKDKILLLQLTTEHWFNNINSTLLSTQESSEQCSVKSQLGIWLPRIDEHQFKQDWLNQLKQLHGVMFNLACELISKHQMGKITQAQTGIDEFKKTYHIFTSHINNYD
jgi:diguanylate cyclase (GGDEF)-like protein/PAS domain S-box-containing protein